MNFFNSKLFPYYLNKSFKAMAFPGLLVMHLQSELFKASLETVAKNAPFRLVKSK